MLDVLVNIMAVCACILLIAITIVILILIISIIKEAFDDWYWDKKLRKYHREE